MNTTTKKHEIYIPIELWKQIKLYMLGQEYWKQKRYLAMMLEGAKPALQLRLIFQEVIWPYQPFQENEKCLDCQ